MKIIDSKDFSSDLIPEKYQHDTFVRFALGFDPRTDSLANDFIYIPLNRFPNKNDSIISIRIYLYSVQRILNNKTYESDEFTDAIKESYKILRLITQKNRE